MLQAEASTVVSDVLASGQYINGPVVKEFEQQFANYIGAADCIACNSGTDALYLALRSLDIGAGDEVITTPFTFIATAEMISAVGATSVFVDIDPHTFNLDLDQVEAAITDRTKAIMPVHLFGQPIDMTRLMAIAKSHNLLVIEDCAQSTGAEWQGAKTGSIGHVGCFSFYPTKNLGACGDGGAVTTSDVAIAQKIHVLRDHGQRQRYVSEEIGVNSRLDAVQAAMLLLKLRYLDEWNEKRRAIANRYTELLNHLPGIITPQSITGGQHVWNQYTIRLIQDSATSSDLLYRDQVRQKLQQQGIGSMIYYPVPLHLQPVFSRLNDQSGKFPVVEQVAQEVLSLPMFPELSGEQQDCVVYALKDCLVG